MGPAIWLAGALLAVAGPAQAAEPVLTVTGLVDGGSRELTLEDLRAMGATELTTSTPWTDQAQTYTGVSGDRFVDALEADGAEVVAKAVNDYHVVIPLEVLDSDEVLVAYAADGEPMSVRDKGPIWILFPFDADSRFLSDTYRTYSIWNLSHLEFR